MHTNDMHVVLNVCQHFKSFFPLIGCYVDDRKVFTLPYIRNMLYSRIFQCKFFDIPIGLQKKE